MICQRCGKCMTPDDMFIVHFKGILLPVDAKWIACDLCAADLTKEVSENFSAITLRSLNIYSYRGQKVMYNGN